MLLYYSYTLNKMGNLFTSKEDIEIRNKLKSEQGLRIRENIRMNSKILKDTTDFMIERLEQEKYMMDIKRIISSINFNSFNNINTCEDLFVDLKKFNILIKLLRIGYILKYFPYHMITIFTTGKHYIDKYPDSVVSLIIPTSNIKIKIQLNFNKGFFKEIIFYHIWSMNKQRQFINNNTTNYIKDIFLMFSDEKTLKECLLDKPREITDIILTFFYGDEYVKDSNINKLSI